MSDFGTLTFLPWMRRGLAGAIATPAVDGLPTSGFGSITAAVTVGGGDVADRRTVRQDVRLRGPGEVVGLSSGQVVRTDPPDRTLNFERNYFPCIELATPDLPWMFTPAAAAEDKLVPWLALVVVERIEGVELGTRIGAPLDVLSIRAPADARDQLPDPAEAWAWAHVQCSADLTDRSVADALSEEPEAFVARLVCPRRLKERTRYLACVVPVFEDGRRAGLGLPVDLEATGAPALAWSAGPSSADEIDLPVYYSWTFRTGPDGDFEELVRRLTPRELEAGTHDLDVGDPGSDRLPEAPGTLVSFKGALVAEKAPVRAWDDPHRRRFRRGMRDLLNEALEADGSAEPEDYDPLTDDPVVAAPVYGSLPAEVDEVPPALADDARPRPRNEPLWLSEANLDPTLRAAGGLGSEVVRRNQESLMATAWEQAAALRDINRLLNQTRLAGEVGAVVKARKVDLLDDAEAVQLASIASRRIQMKPRETVAARLSSTPVPSGLASTAFKRIARPGGTAGRGSGKKAATSNLAARATEGFLTNLEDRMGFAAYVQPLGLQVADESIIQGMPGSADDVKPKPARDLVAYRGARMPVTRAIADPTGKTIVGSRAVMPVFGVAEGQKSPTVEKVFEVSEGVRAGLDPVGTLRKKLESRIDAPPAAWGTATLPAAMRATPVFEDPLYELLRRISPEFLLPGIGEVPDDTVGLTEVNAAFVEAFLLGANHELAREFLWREYPADLRDTWLHTFWDAIAADGSGVADIDPVRGWPGSNRLGGNQAGVAADGTVVLVIKGQLLRRYPDTAIYATRARWSDDRAERVERTNADGTPFERKDPLFVGALDRDTVFLGFDLDTEQAKGDAEQARREPGWFFVFEEPPAEPRFGLDVGKPRHAGKEPGTWANASWGHQVETSGDLASLTHAEATGRLAGVQKRYDEDRFRATWGEDSAEMARITLQRPVRMLVHASAMLP